MNYFELMRNWFDFCFENPDKVKPTHTAVFCFAVEHCNRLGWKQKFGFPTTMAMEALGIKSYNTFINTLKDIVDFGFIEMIEKSKNQYSANIIALSNFNKALDKALDKALIKHSTKQSESTVQSTDSIDRQYTKDNNTSVPKSNEDISFKVDFTLEAFKTNEANEAWTKWLQYNIQEHKPISRIRQEEIKKKLKQHATHNGQLFEKVIPPIIDKCISSGWKNIVVTEEMEAKIKNHVREANN